MPTLVQDEHVVGQHHSLLEQLVQGLEAGHNGARILLPQQGLVKEHVLGGIEDPGDELVAA